MATPWNNIKAEYLAGATPKDLAMKYRIPAKSISNKAYEENWTRKKQEISENLEEQLKSEFEEITKKGVERLKELLVSDEIKPNDLLSAIKLAFETTIFKKKDSKEQAPEDAKQAINITFVDGNKI